jgi:hypothetical protein
MEPGTTPSVDAVEVLLRAAAPIDAAGAAVRAASLHAGLGPDRPRGCRVTSRSSCPGASCECVGGAPTCAW